MSVVDGFSVAADGPMFFRRQGTGLNKSLKFSAMIAGMNPGKFLDFYTLDK